MNLIIYRSLPIPCSFRHPLADAKYSFLNNLLRNRIILQTKDRYNFKLNPFNSLSSPLIHKGDPIGVMEGLLEAKNTTDFPRYEDLPDELKINILKLCFEDDFKIQDVHPCTPARKHTSSAPVSITVNQSHHSFSNVAFVVEATPHFRQLFVSKSFLDMALPVYAKSRSFELICLDLPSIELIQKTFCMEVMNRLIQNVESLHVSVQQTDVQPLYPLSELMPKLRTVSITP